MDTETPEAALMQSFFLTRYIFLKAISCFRTFHDWQLPLTVSMKNRTRKTSHLTKNLKTRRSMKMKV